jgi:predicted ATP-grasp superfamily ATP-dependent carboligase
MSQSPGVRPTLVVGVSTRAIAESARRAGYDVTTIDAFGDLDQKVLCPNVSLRERGMSYSATAFVELARELDYDDVVYGGGLENHPSVVAELARGRVLLGNAPDVLEKVRDPLHLFPILAGEGFAVPAIAGEGKQARSSMTWLCKPVRSGGGRGIRWWRGGRLPRHHILEEYVEGRAGSASFVADGKRCVLLGATRQLRGPRRFLYGGNLFPLDVPAETVEEIRSIAGALTRVFGLRGVNGFDFVLRGTRPVVVEVNPRYCASMELMERATGCSIFALHVDACHGRLPATPPPAPHGVWGKRIVYAPGDFRVGDTSAWLARGWRDVPVSDQAFAAGQPICTVLASAPATAECERRLVAEAEAVYASRQPEPVGGPR